MSRAKENNDVVDPPAQRLSENIKRTVHPYIEGKSKREGESERAFLRRLQIHGKGKKKYKGKAKGFSKDSRAALTDEKRRLKMEEEQELLLCFGLSPAALKKICVVANEKMGKQSNSNRTAVRKRTRQSIPCADNANTTSPPEAKKKKDTKSLEETVESDFIEEDIPESVIHAPSPPVSVNATTDVVVGQNLEESSTEKADLPAEHLQEHTDTKAEETAAATATVDSEGDLTVDKGHKEDGGLNDEDSSVEEQLQDPVQDPNDEIIPRSEGNECISNEEEEKVELNAAQLEQMQKCEATVSSILQTEHLHTMTLEQYVKKYKAYGQVVRHVGESRFNSLTAKIAQNKITKSLSTAWIILLPQTQTSGQTKECVVVEGNCRTTYLHNLFKTNPHEFAAIQKNKISVIAYNLPDEIFQELKGKGVYLNEGKSSLREEFSLILSPPTQAFLSFITEEDEEAREKSNFSPADKFSMMETTYNSIIKPRIDHGDVGDVVESATNFKEVIEVFKLCKQYCNRKCHSVYLSFACGEQTKEVVKRFFLDEEQIVVPDSLAEEFFMQASLNDNFAQTFLEEVKKRKGPQPGTLISGAIAELGEILDKEKKAHRAKLDTMKKRKNRESMSKARSLAQAKTCLHATYLGKEFDRRSGDIVLNIQTLKSVLDDSDDKHVQLEKLRKSVHFNEVLYLCKNAVLVAEKNEIDEKSMRIVWELSKETDSFVLLHDGKDQQSFAKFASDLHELKPHKSKKHLLLIKAGKGADLRLAIILKAGVLCSANLHMQRLESVIKENLTVLREKNIHVCQLKFNLNDVQ